jgi:predicted P-loop ATPase
MAEMDAQARASASAMKAFITRRYDNFVPRWGKHPIKLPRQCVFTGTINPPVGGYLKDPTGARRFWPVECHGMIDVEALERSRDQLWAEAVAQYHAGKKWWLETPELEALATAEQRLRFKSDVWREPVKRWLGRRKDVSLSEVMKGALRIALLDQDQRAQNRVVDILTELGFTKYRARNGDRRPSRYRRP